MVLGYTQAGALHAMEGSGCSAGGGRDHPSVLEKAGQVLILDDKKPDQVGECTFEY